MSRPPNILITGTPGVGKTTTAEAVATALGFAHVDIGKAITEQELHSGWDDEFECNIVDDQDGRRARRARSARARNVHRRRGGGGCVCARLVVDTGAD